MRSAVGTRENIKIIDSAEYGGCKVEIMEYQNLLGSMRPSNAQTMYYMEKQNIRARQPAFYLQNDTIKIEPGAMSYYMGNIEMVSGLTVGNALGRVFSGAITGENAAQPEYKGTGMVVLEPSFKHFLVLQMENEEIIIDKGMFYGCQSSITVKPVMQRNVSSALLGGEGLFQISLRGTGVAVLECAVPCCEIDVIELVNDTLKVDGNFAVLRSGNLDFTVERSAKTLIGSAASGEGLVNVYKGTGSVWLAPTIKVYENLSLGISTSSSSTSGTSSNR